jgi:hypothetical protein
MLFIYMPFRYFLFVLSSPGYNLEQGGEILTKLVLKRVCVEKMPKKGVAACSHFHPLNHNS